MLNAEIHYTKQSASDQVQEEKEMVSCTIELTMNAEEEFDKAIEVIKNAKEHYTQLVKLANIA